MYLITNGVDVMSELLSDNTLFKSVDGQYIYNVVNYQPTEKHFTLEVLTANLEFIEAIKDYTVFDFTNQMLQGHIVNYR